MAAASLVQLGTFALVPAQRPRCPTQRIRYLHTFSHASSITSGGVTRQKSLRSQVVPFRRSHAETVHTWCTGCLAVKKPTSSAPECFVPTWMGGPTMRRLLPCLTLEYRSTRPSFSKIISLKQWGRGRLSVARQLNIPIPYPSPSVPSQVSSPGTSGACARVSFTTNDDQKHLNESPMSVANATGAISEAAAGATGTAGAATTQGPSSACAENKQDQASVTSGATDSRGSSVTKTRHLSPPHGGKENKNLSKHVCWPAPIRTI